MVGIELPVAGGGAAATGDAGRGHRPMTGAARGLDAIGQSAMGFVRAGPPCTSPAPSAGTATPEEDGSRHGVVTKAAGLHVINEIDGEPAFDVYRARQGGDGAFTDDMIEGLLKKAKAAAAAAASGDDVGRSRSRGAPAIWG